jgi:hypothetical protein
MMKNCTRIRAGLILFVVFYLSFSAGIKAGDVIVRWDPNTEPDLLGYKVYWGTSSRNYTDFGDANNDTSYRVPNLPEGVEYFFAVTAYDTAYNESDFSVEVSHTISVSDIDPPEISSVTLISATDLDLTFNEDVEDSSAENLSNYQIDNGITITSITLDSNKRLVHIKTTSHQPGNYTITVSKVADISGNLIVPNSSKSYQYDPGDTTPPTIVSAQILDATHVDVTFSEEIEASSAQTVANFKINNNISIFHVNLDQNQRTVQLVTSNHQSGTTYTLTVSNIHDRAQPPNSILANSTKQYTYTEVDVTLPEIYSVNIRNANLVDVIFSEKVEQTSAENVQNYEINNGVNVLVAILNTNQKTVHLSTTTHSANLTFTLTVNNVTDRAQPANVIEPNTTYDYSYRPDDHSPPTLISAVAWDETQVDVNFSEPIDRYSAEDENNYAIDKGIVVIEALLDTNKTVVHLTTTPHQTGEMYTLTVNNITDRAPTPNEIAPASKIPFSYTYQDLAPPEIEDVQIIYSTYVKIFFNENMEQESAEKIGNYSINGGIQVIGAILDNSQKIVHLTTSEYQTNTSYTLTVNNVRDRSPNRNPIKPNTKFQYEFEVSSGSIVLGLSKDNYELAYLNVNDEYYIDRTYKINSIPEEMTGYLWIKTANDDRDKKDEEFLSFQLSEAAKIYVAYDSRALNYPNWLVNDFYRVGKQVGVSEYADKLDLWVKQCEPGVITLGANLAEGTQGVESMYVVLIASKNGQPPDAPENMADPLSFGPANMFLLYQNYPNPFNAGTEIRFQLPNNADVELTIYNILGQTVRILTQGYKTAGHHIMKWDGRNENGLSVPTGVYFSRLIIKKIEDIEGKTIYRTVYNYVRKMIMVR